MTASISELSTRSQEDLLLGLAGVAKKLIEQNENWRRDGVELAVLMEILLDKSPRSNREVFYGLQYALSRGLLAEEGERIVLSSESV